MFWILRRTGAANFFNSLNNNCNTKVNNNNNNDSKRPPRKAYGRLSVDADDETSMKSNHIDNACRLDELNNFELFDNDHHHQFNFDNNHDDEDEDSTGGGVGNGNCNGKDSFQLGDDSDLELNGPSRNVIKQQRQKEINENTINRLQAIAMSDDEDFDESLTCNVCDRAFSCHRQLASHQQKKRHFGCSGCDSLFPSLMLLEHHKEEFEHWSDDEENRYRPCCRRNRGDDFTDTDSITSEAESEDLERLL